MKYYCCYWRKTQSWMFRQKSIKSGKYATLAVKRRENVKYWARHFTFACHKYVPDIRFTFIGQYMGDIAPKYFWQASPARHPQQIASVFMKFQILPAVDWKRDIACKTFIFSGWQRLSAHAILWRHSAFPVAANISDLKTGSKQHTPIKGKNGNQQKHPRHFLATKWTGCRSADAIWGDLCRIFRRH